MKKTILVVLWVLSLAATFYVGTRIGARENGLAYSQYRAANIAANLKLIEKNKIDDLKSILETDLNGEIATYSYYLDSDWKWLWPEYWADKQPKGIIYAVQYRKSHPYVEYDFANPKNRSPNVPANNPFIVELIEGQKQNLKRVNRVVKLYE